MDTCGTGGDGAGTFNVSTTCAFVVAGAGVQVAKHGNRALSSQCGSADVFEALGIPMRASPLLALEALERVGICFLFAPFFHKAMKHALVPRQQMGVRTVFNLLGPLTNPLHATVRLIGVYSRSFVDKLARVAGELGVARAFVVWGEDGTDEITVAARTYICELENGDTRSYWIQPEDYGITRATREQLAGGAPEQNARMILRILQGQEYGPTRDIVLLNAAYCLLGAGKAHSIEQGLEQARRSIEDRLALDKLQQLRTFYRERLERGTQL